MSIRRFALQALALGFLTVTLAACGSTWDGLKQDTGENLETTGDAIEGAGTAVKP